MHLKLNDQTMQVEPVDLKPKPPKRPGRASAATCCVGTVHKY